MLIRPDATFVDQATQRAERIFPSGESWLNFESRLPGSSVFANSVLEPSVGVGGELAIETFARADWSNWISTTKISLFEIGTRVGLTPTMATPMGQSLAQVYTNLEHSFSAYQSGAMPEELIPELLKNTGLQALQAITGQGSMIAQTVGQVLAAAIWAADVWAAHRSEQLGKNVALPPLQSEDPATDAWQVNRVFTAIRQRGTGGIVYPDGKIEAASNADYTSFFLPAYRYGMPWMLQHRAKGVAAQQGGPQRARGPGGDAQYQFDAGDATTFGFMPGTTTTLRVLQASYRFYKSVRGTAVDRYALRCRGVNKPCWKGPKGFDGSKDCRQCVKAESVWPTEGLGWTYGGAPLNATTPGENVGAFYPSLNKLLLNLLETIVQPGPLLFTVDFEVVYHQWRRTFEKFWTFIAEEWRRHPGYGQRGQLSRLATLMTAYVGDDGLRMGGRDPSMPMARIQSPRESEFRVPFSVSIFDDLIGPYCQDAAVMQLHYLDTLELAYIPPGAGALYRPDGKLKSSDLGNRFRAARAALLTSTKRMLVDLRRVTDPEYREALRLSGVKPSIVNPLLQGSPGVSHELLTPQVKPPRAPRRPRRAGMSPLAGLNALSSRAPKPARASTNAAPNTPSKSSPGKSAALLGLGVTAGTAVAAAAVTALHVRQSARQPPEDPDS